MKNAIVRLGATVDRYAEGHASDWLKPLVLNAYADGEPLHDICARPGYPPVNTVMYWIDTDEEFAQFWCYAKAARAERISSQIDGAIAALQATVDGSRTEIQALKTAIDSLFRRRAEEIGAADPGPAADTSSEHNHTHIRVEGGLNLSAFPPQREPVSIPAEFETVADED